MWAASLHGSDALAKDGVLIDTFMDEGCTTPVKAGERWRKE